MLNNDPMSPDEDFSTNMFNPAFQQGFMNPSSAMQIAENPSISLKTGLGYPISSLLGFSPVHATGWSPPVINNSQPVFSPFHNKRFGTKKN